MPLLNFLYQFNDSDNKTCLVIVPENDFWKEAFVSFIFAIRPVWDRRLVTDVDVVVTKVVVVVVVAVKVEGPDEHSDPLPDTGEETLGDQISLKKCFIEKFS